MIELLSTSEMAEADRLAIAQGRPGMELMENAGKAVARNVVLRHPPGTRVVVVAGPGNNGGDGFVAARHLQERGYRARVLLAGDRSRLKGDAAQAAQLWKGQCEPATPEAMRGADAIIDALFGAGLDRPIEGPARALIETMNAGPCVHAVDLPSGINGTTGAVMGTAVRARHTITFFRRKLGHVLLPGRTHCGEIDVADIGIPASVLERINPSASIISPTSWGDIFPVPRPSAHKYARGHAVVVSGSAASTGAARLAARGALRAGAGLVTIASPRDALATNAATNLAIMVRRVDGKDELAEFLRDPRRNAVALGPGGGVGAGMRELVRVALAGERAVVLDADALTSFAEEPEQLISLLAGRKVASVLTPHEGEFSRVFASLAAVSKAQSKAERGREAARRAGAVCILKGADTVVASPDGRCGLLDHAPAWLATAGAGDVLTGIVTGLLAQGMPAFEAGCAAVWLHARAAAVHGPGLIAEDLPEALPAVYSGLIPQIEARRPTCEEHAGALA
jgi:ADP-dependent NAD(P)H-hydrate dehydratase / NAD(P)H-hydrate epimerase